MYDHLRGEIEAFTVAMENMEEPTRANVEKLPQFKDLERESKKELRKFTAFTEATLEAAAIAAIVLGLAHSREFVKLAGIKGFVGLDAKAMIPLLDYLAKGSPLYQRLELITTSTVDSVIETILEGVALGYNPRKIASQIQDSFGGGLTDALRNTRTVQINSYRDSARANYMATGGLVTGWIWYAELDGNQCEACTAEHGTIHDLDEQLDGHYNCRCSALPYIEGVTDEVTSGEDWFNGLSEAEQKSYLGETKYNAYKDKKFQFSDMTKRTSNEVYGQMIGVKPLSELIGE
jgi:SPP1 gp7 family putative phage head morphogenesis protein